MKKVKNCCYFAFILCSHESLNVFWSNVKAQQPVFLTFDAKLTPILQIRIISHVIFQFSMEITTNFWCKVVKIPINRYFQVQISSTIARTTSIGRIELVISITVTSYHASVHDNMQRKATEIQHNG